jgi:hypothetical protein
MKSLSLKTQIQVARGILDMKQMGLKPRARSLASCLPLPHHQCRKLSVLLCFHFPPIEEYLVDRLAIGCMG